MKATHTAAIAALLVSSGLSAQPAPRSDAHDAHHAPAAAANAPKSQGEVRRVDLAQGKVTLRHGPLANLDMPAMTMVFTTSDPKLLEGLKQGDKVHFTADKKDGAYVVTAIEVAR